MKKILLIFASAVLFAAVSCSETAGHQPVKVIFDTDMGNDIDDALALDMLYKYMDAGTVDLLAVMVNKEGFGPVEYVDMMNTWYGYPEIPIGRIDDGIDCNYPESNYAHKVASVKDDDGNPMFPMSVSDPAALPQAHELYRKILANEPDGSVTIISVGFSTNLVRLLDSAPDQYSDLTGAELVARKVRLLSVMAGDFKDQNHAEFNVIQDIPAAEKVFETWPTPVVASPFEVGVQICYPASSIENDFAWAEKHPVVEGYKAWGKMPYDRPTWDLTSVLYAVEGGGLFTVSPAGKIDVDERGCTVFTPCGEGDRYYLSVDESQAKSVLDRFLEIVPAQPKNR